MKQIIIAQRGWVFVGDVKRNGDEVVISNAQNVRVWGTTRGLGEIAINGPTAKTVLDDYGTVHLHALGVVAAIDCNADSWE